MCRLPSRPSSATISPGIYVAGSPIEGGHAVLFGGYGTPVPGLGPAAAGPYKDETWAEESSLTEAFWVNLVVQLWFPVWKEQMGTAEFQAGVDEAAFAAEYTAITGQPFPAVIPPAVPPVPAPPSPPPAPTPVPVPPAPVPPLPPPVPGPDTNPADVALAHSVTAWAYGHRNAPDLAVAGALRAWLSAKGFPE